MGKRQKKLFQFSLFEMAFSASLISPNQKNAGSSQNFELMYLQKTQDSKKIQIYFYFSRYIGGADIHFTFLSVYKNIYIFLCINNYHLIFLYCILMHLFYIFII
mgnify:CR=1 FL=1